MEKVKFLGLKWSEGHYQLFVTDNVDCLPCDINEYLGQRIITRAKLRKSKGDLISLFNEKFKKQLTKITIV